MEYINTKTGATIITDNEISGGDWISKKDYQNSTENLTVPEIKSKLDELGIDYDSKAAKADLLALLEQHEG